MDEEGILLMEGQDDIIVCQRLFEHYSFLGVTIREPMEREKTGGFEKIHQTIRVWLKRSGLKRLGLVVDADVDIQARWEFFRNILGEEGYHGLPKTPGKDGRIIKQNGRPTVGIWIMPDNNSVGMLEDFIAFLVPEGDQLLPLVEGCLDRIPVEHRRFRQRDRSKAKIHTYLVGLAR